jgi:transcription elongation factor GreA
MGNPDVSAPSATAGPFFLQRSAPAFYPAAGSLILFMACQKGCDAMEKIPMTAAGHAALESELKRRTSQERPRIIELIAEARGHGDLSENAEYHAAKEQHGLNEGRIMEIEDQLSRAEIIDISKLSGKTITFGATVVLIDEDTEEKKKYQIVGDVEADVKLGKISISSPIARALIGKVKGDTVEVTAPGGARSYEILDVKYA